MQGYPGSCCLELNLDYYRLLTLPAPRIPGKLSKSPKEIWKSLSLHKHKHNQLFFIPVFKNDLKTPQINLISRNSFDRNVFVFSVFVITKVMEINFCRDNSSWQDTFCLWLNMVPLGLAALIRAIFWSLGVPISIWSKTFTDSKWEDDFLTVLPASSRQDVSNKSLESTCFIESIWKELKSRKAHRFPHAGGRQFTEHIVGKLCPSSLGLLTYHRSTFLNRTSSGVANLLKQWEQPLSLCVAGLLHSLYSTEMFP
jgi:hypothetical protein